MKEFQSLDLLKELLLIRSIMYHVAFVHVSWAVLCRQLPSCQDILCPSSDNLQVIQASVLSKYDDNINLVISTYTFSFPNLYFYSTFLAKMQSWKVLLLCTKCHNSMPKLILFSRVYNYVPVWWWNCLVCWSHQRKTLSFLPLCPKQTGVYATLMFSQKHSRMIRFFLHLMLLTRLIKTF